MNTGELLDYLRVDILHDNSQQVAGSGDDQLWSDTSLIRNINEAYKRWARLTYSIRDATTTAVTEVTLVEGTTEYTLHKSVIAVISARLEGQTYDLGRAGHSIFQSYYNPSTRFWDPEHFATLSPGAVIAFSTDEGVTSTAGAGGKVRLRVYPEPDATMDGEKIYLRVVRGPIADLSLATPTVEPEISDDHHVEMLDWAAYLCLRTVDLDEGAPDRAQEFKAAFEANVLEAKKLAVRKLFAPKKWGFGRNAFQPWER